jgi:16S rRNA (guanine966-N2)-methyltransferase
MRIISGQFKGRSVPAVEGPGYRPALGKVREAVFSMLEARGVYWPEANVLDVFAGSGSLGLEALSRGAPYACFVENSAKAAACIGRALKDFGLGPDRAGVVKADAFSYLKSRPERRYSVVFVDPPYRRDMAAPALAIIAAGDRLSQEALVVAEIEKGAETPEAPGLELDADRKYGQTRILIWRKSRD